MALAQSSDFRIEIAITNYLHSRYPTTQECRLTLERHPENDMMTLKLYNIKSNMVYSTSFRPSIFRDDSQLEHVIRYAAEKLGHEYVTQVPFDEKKLKGLLEQLL